MDKCQFSEFSYGYCLTEDLIVGQGTQITAAPIFPSLIEEGQPGVGYDLRLERPGVPLFLQFKLVHQMVRGTAKEAKLNHFVPPFYRMHLRPRSISDQHQSLISLEQQGYEVFYAAPAFHTIQDLNTSYAQSRVWDRSFKIAPSAIGPLPDDKGHHVTFSTANGLCRRYSDDPTEERYSRTTKDIAQSLIEKIQSGGRRNLKQQVEELDARLVDVVTERNPLRRRQERIAVDELGLDIDPIHRAAYLARQFFDCQLLYVTQK